MMNSSSKIPITDELLSAYIDGAVTEEEKASVEMAMAADPEIAWRVETLRQTVQLLQELPPVALPRQFVLDRSQVADVLVERRANPGSSASATGSQARSSWQQLLAFFNSGNLALRNATAIAVTLFVLLVVGDPLWANFVHPGGARQTAPAVLEPESAAVVAQTQSTGPTAEREAPQAPTAQPETQMERAASPGPTSAEIAAAVAEEGTEAENAQVAEATPIPPTLRSRAAPSESDQEPAASASVFSTTATKAAAEATTTGPSAVTMMQEAEESPAESVSSTATPPSIETSTEAMATEAMEEEAAAAQIGVTPEAEGSPEAIAKAEAEVEGSQPAGADTMAVAEEPQSVAVEPAATTEPTQPGVDVWLAMQMATLALAIVLGLLWLRSRRTNVHR